MNLRIDLIMDSEKRSASVLNAKSLMRMGAIIVPCILVVMVLIGSIKVLKSKSDEKTLTQRWEILEKKQKDAKGLRDEAAINNRIKEELQGWEASHMDWHSQAIGLQRIAPINMQFTRMRITQTLQLVKNKYPARYYKLTLSGKAKGTDAEASINHFIATVKDREVFTAAMDDVVIKHFGEDRDENADRQDRIFEIECIYKAKEFRKPREKK